MLLLIIMVIFGLIALIKGEIKITNKRKVSGDTGRILGIILLVGACGGFIESIGAFIQIGAFILVIIIGLIKAVPISEN